MNKNYSTIYLSVDVSLFRKRLTGRDFQEVENLVVSSHGQGIIVLYLWTITFIHPKVDRVLNCS